MDPRITIISKSSSPEVLNITNKLNTLLTEFGSVIAQNPKTPLIIEVTEQLLNANQIMLINTNTNEKEIIKLNIAAINLLYSDCKPDVASTKRDVVACILRHHSDKDKYLFLRWKTTAWRSFVSGGREDKPVKEAGMQEIQEETGYKNIRFIKELDCEAFDKFYAPHKDVNRFINTKCGVFELIDDERNELDAKEKELHECVWKHKSEMRDALNIKTNQFFWDVYLNEYYSLNGLRDYIEYKLSTF